MSKHLVSVLMPVYNAEKFIQKSIDSILNQSYKEIELLILNDASLDNTLLNVYAYKDPRIVVLKNEFNQGYLKSCNQLFKVCKGDYITFQDADDWSDKFRIEKLVYAMTSIPAIELCASNHNIVIDDLVIENTTISEEINFLRKAIPFQFPCVGSSVMITRRVLNEIGGYHPFFDRMGGEDLEWISRIIDRFNSIVLNDPLYFYRFTANSVSNKNYSLISITMSEILEYGIIKRRISGINPFDEFLGKEIKWVIKKIGIPDARISELYRARAARDVDRKKFRMAFSCIKNSLKYNFFSVKNFQTLFYWLRSQVIEIMIRKKIVS